jgi:hypothetical protein
MNHESFSFGIEQIARRRRRRERIGRSLAGVVEFARHTGRLKVLALFFHPLRR